jgi:type I restriction enzyme R subunit
MKFNEDSRVKILTILHLIRLGYKYLALKDPSVQRDTSNNIFTDLFHQSIKKIKPFINYADTKPCYVDESLCLVNEYFGQAFYERETDTSDLHLIEFKTFSISACLGIPAKDLWPLQSS